MLTGFTKFVPIFFPIFHLTLLIFLELQLYHLHLEMFLRVLTSCQRKFWPPKSLWRIIIYCSGNLKKHCYLFMHWIKIQNAIGAAKLQLSINFQTILSRKYLIECKNFFFPILKWVSVNVSPLVVENIAGWKSIFTKCAIKGWISCCVIFYVENVEYCQHWVYCLEQMRKWKRRYIT